MVWIVLGVAGRGRDGSCVLRCGVWEDVHALQCALWKCIPTWLVLHTLAKYFFCNLF